MLSAYVLCAVASYGPGAAGIIEVDRQNILMVSYDDRGIIEHYEFIRKFQADGQGKPGNIELLARQWAAKMHRSRSFTPPSSPVGESLVYVLNHLDLERSRNSLDGVFLDGKLWTELEIGQYTAIPVSPGFHVIGLERDIRTTDKFLHPERQASVPSVTETIDVRPNQAYYLEIFYIERDSRDFKKTPIFSRLSESVALPKLAGLKRVR